MTLPVPAADDAAPGLPLMPARVGAPAMPVPAPVVESVPAGDATVEDVPDLSAAVDLDDAPAPVAAPAPAAPEAGRALVLIEDGKVVHAPESVLVLNVDDLTSPERSADDLFDALKTLGTVAPSEARDGLADRITAALRGRLSL